jgi:hypothetical protein
MVDYDSVAGRQSEQKEKIRMKIIIQKKSKDKLKKISKISKRKIKIKERN